MPYSFKISSLSVVSGVAISVVHKPMVHIQQMGWDVWKIFVSHRMVLNSAAPLDVILIASSKCMQGKYKPAMRACSTIRCDYFGKHLFVIVLISDRCVYKNNIFLHSKHIMCCLLTAKGNKICLLSQLPDKI